MKSSVAISLTSNVFDSLPSQRRRQVNVVVPSRSKLFPADGFVTSGRLFERLLQSILWSQHAEVDLCWRVWSVVVGVSMIAKVSVCYGGIGQRQSQNLWRARPP